MLGVGMVVGAAAAAAAVCTMYPDIPRRVKRDGKRMIKRTKQMF